MLWRLFEWAAWALAGSPAASICPALRKAPDLQLVAVCDIDPEALRYAWETYGIDEAHCFTDYHDLINCPDVDAVDISTPNNVHFEVAMAAAQAGKPYAVEKPITLNSEQADALAQVTREKNVKNMVCFSYRFKAAARYAKDLIQRGMLGTIYHVDMQYYQAWGLPFCQTPLVWRFQKDLTGSGALGDLGSHALDLVRFGHRDRSTPAWSATRAPLFRSGRSWTALAWARWMWTTSPTTWRRWHGGIRATFRITRFGYGRGNYQTMEIYGSEGAIQYSWTTLPRYR